jgi:hypothetical protein
MDRKTTHTQVRMRNDDGRVDTSWIPTRYAVKGRRLTLGKDKNDFGWNVTDVYGTEDTDKVMADSRDHTRTRAASDI